jgi:signal transduction histidine kinase
MSLDHPTGASYGATEGGGHPAAALAVLAVSWTLALIAIVLGVLNRPESHPGTWYFVVDLADAIVFGCVGAVLVARTDHPASWIVATTGIGGGLAAIGSQWFELALDDPELPTLAVVSSMQNWAWIPGTLALILVLPYLVREVPAGAMTRAAVAAGIALTGVMTVTRLTDPYPWPDGPTMAPFAIRSEWWIDVLARLDPWLMGGIATLGLVAAADVTRRWAARPPERRRGLGWLAIATALMSLSFVPLALPAGNPTEDLPAWFVPSLHLLSQLFFPAALLVAVLGQRLWGLQLAVSRAALWSLLTGGIFVTYAAVVWVVSSLLPDNDVAPLAIATAAIAAGFGPARAFAQRRVDNLVRGSAGDPARMKRDVVTTSSTVGGTALRDVVDSIVASLRLGGASIDLLGADGSRRVVTVGEVDHAPLEVPLAFAGDPIGLLVVSARRGERLDRRSLESLHDLTSVVAATLQLLRTSEALGASQRRVALVRDEERRALRRELHDGLGPSLAGVGLGLRACANLLDSDPERARALLELLASEIDDNVEEVRSMARGMLPPGLDELGLEASVEGIAERHRLGGLDVAVEAIGAVPDLSPEVAGEIYAVVAEAVRNVHRHASAQRCRITMGMRDEGFVVRVIDDGVGIGAGVPAGVGLSSMAERADGLGGTLAVIPGDAGGTVVELRVPIGSAVRS